jgi:predicted amidohydrolase YtcJ
MATTIFEARKIITMNPSRPQATHVAVRDGRIVCTEHGRPVSPAKSNA